jgi:hypothetical protein
MTMAAPFFSPTAIFFTNGNYGPPWTPPPERARRIILPRAKMNPSTFTSTVTWSNYMRYCQHDGCNRVIGRNGKSYLYGVAPGEPKRDVCRRCHRKLQRPSLKKWRIANGFG